jgi:hypothetical protein
MPAKQDARYCIDLSIKPGVGRPWLHTSYHPDWPKFLFDGIFPDIS